MFKIQISLIKQHQLVFVMLMQKSSSPLSSLTPDIQPLLKERFDQTSSSLQPKDI